MIADFGSARAHIGPGGKLRALALSADKRVAAFPTAPTVGEEGLPKLNSMNGWLGVFAPAKTPKDIVDKLAADELKADLGYEATGTGGEKFALIVKQDTDRWGAVIKSIGGVTLD